MRTKRNFAIGVANVTIQPHSPKKYIRLFKKASALKKAVPVHGEINLRLMGSIFSLVLNDPEAGIYGEIAKFTEIPEDAEWINLKSEKKADEEEKLNINIPENLRPNYQGFTFIFFPKHHYFVWEQKYGKFSLSPRLVEKFLVSLFSSKEISRSFGDVSVTIIPATNKVDEILNIPDLRKLNLKFVPPNPDDLEDLEEEVMKALNEENVAEKEISSKAIKGKSLSPSEKTKLLAKIAANNGSVTGDGFDMRGNKVQDSTRNHPLIEHGNFDLDKTNLLDAMLSLSLKVIDKIKNG